jgi:hypothetical protein
MEARPYPVHLLEGHRTGLLLYGAGFLGHNDAVHYAMAGLECTVVDTDAGRLDEMRGLYDGAWAFVAADAVGFAEAAADADMFWDCVSVDPYTGDAMAVAHERLELWCSVARHLVTMGCQRGDTWRAPAGWHSHLYERDGAGMFWLTLERE